MTFSFPLSSIITAILGGKKPLANEKALPISRTRDDRDIALICVFLFSIVAIVVVASLAARRG